MQNNKIIDFKDEEEPQEIGRKLGMIVQTICCVNGLPEVVQCKT